MSLASALVESSIAQHIHVQTVHNLGILLVCRFDRSPRGIVDLKVQGTHVHLVSLGGGVRCFRRYLWVFRRVFVDFREVPQHSDAIAPRVLKVHSGRSISADQQ